MTKSGRAASLLGIFAHPDDESLACGGLMARAASLGITVVALSLTRGEAGRSTSVSAKASLGDIRSNELHAAARALGIARAEVGAHEDGMLPWLAPADLEASIRAALDVHHPDVVVTFDVDGLYWHPDHIAVHERTTAVIAQHLDAPALYYVTLPPGQMRAVSTRAGGRPVVPGLDDPDAFGSHAPAPSLIVDAGPLAVRKLRAIQAHVSQFAASAWAGLTDADAALIATEHYRRAEVGAAGPTWLDALGVAVSSPVS